jgi:hypothetical protein
VIFGVRVFAQGSKNKRIAIPRGRAIRATNIIRINEYTDRKWSFCSVYTGKYSRNKITGLANIHKTDTRKNNSEQKKTSQRLSLIRVSVYWDNKITALLRESFLDGYLNQSTDG